MEIKLPTKIDSQVIEPNHSQITVSSCYPGYGTTLGNALRRVLLSSMPGAAAFAVRIKGADHEFSTIPNVKEDVLEIILNLKKLRFRVFSDEEIELNLKVKGKKEVTAADFEKNTEVEIVNKEIKIATLNDKSAELDIKLSVRNGRGYVPVELREKEKLPVGYIAIDAIYTPIKNVNFKIEHVRVEQMTNYDKLILDIVTDGTLSPEEAFVEACQILMSHFTVLKDSIVVEKTDKKKKYAAQKK
jgi:DNA-directed RNA polymerase subunit alpha